MRSALQGAAPCNISPSLVGRAGKPGAVMWQRRPDNVLLPTPVTRGIDLGVAAACRKFKDKTVEPLLTYGAMSLPGRIRSLTPADPAAAKDSAPGAESAKSATTAVRLRGSRLFAKYVVLLVAVVTVALLFNGISDAYFY